MNSESQPGRRILGPFNRVEGDLEVEVEADQEQITRAWVNAPLFRGYEQIMHGKDPRDALVYTPRICGICSVSQSVAAARAIASAQGIEPTDNGLLATNLILATENLADHLTHFYLFFMPDFARDCYRSKPWFETTFERFKAQTGSAYGPMLQARAAFLHITGILAGKWPHSLAIQPGGTTRPVQPQEQVRLLSTIQAFRHFLQHSVFGVDLETLAELGSADQLFELAERHPASDLARFIGIGRDLQLDRLGRASDNFMSYGAYDLGERHLFKSGVWLAGAGENPAALDSNRITEDLSHSWMNSQPEAKHPYHGSTIPDDSMAQGYSWCKAPRLGPEVMEVGALARQQVSGHPLIRALVAQSGGNVFNRVIARLLELALVVPQMQQWLQQLQRGKPYCHSQAMPDETEGAGLVEAARGSLGHWMRVRNGRILNYQIIAPTTWNFSPRDQAEQPGALEQALAGTGVTDEGGTDARIQHIIRSFDPCMVCTVH